MKILKVSKSVMPLKSLAGPLLALSCAAVANIAFAGTVPTDKRCSDEACKQVTSAYLLSAAAPAKPPYVVTEPDDGDRDQVAIVLAPGGSAVGASTLVSGRGGSAFGAGSSALADYATAVGYGAFAQGASSVAAGHGAEAHATAVAVGGTIYDTVSGRPRMDERTGENFAGAYAYDSGVALGASSRAMGFGAVGLGAAALAQADLSLAIGPQAFAKREQSIALGYGAFADGEQSIVIGGNTAGGRSGREFPVQSYAKGFGGVAIGSGSTAWSDFGTAVGWGAGVQSIYTTAFGANSGAMTWGASALGVASYSTGASSLAMGFHAYAGGNYSLAIGGVYGLDAQGKPPTGRDGDVGVNATPYDQTNAMGDKSIALGVKAQTNGLGAVAAGFSSQANGNGSIAIGQDALADGDQTMAMGQGASVGATVSNAVALGAGSVADRSNTVSVGKVGAERQLTNVADGSMGTDAVTKRQLDQAVLTLANVSAIGLLQLSDMGQQLGTVVGGGSSFVGLSGQFVAPTYFIQGTAYRDIAGAFGAVDTALSGLRNGALASAPGSGRGISAGSGSHAQDTGDVAIGQNSHVGADNSVAIGTNANVAQSAQNSVALGANASATASNSVALGAGAVANEANTVSVGSPQATRRVTNVAAGQAVSDAANVGQVNQAIATAQAYTDKRFGQAVDRTSFDTFRDQTDRRFSVMSNRFDRMGAMNAASTQMAINAGGVTPGNGRLAVGVGSQSSERALSLGYAKTLGEAARMSVGATVGRGEQSVGVGFGVDL